MKNLFNRPRRRRNQKNTTQRTGRKLGTVENLETRKLLTASGLAAEPVDLQQDAPPAVIASADVNHSVDMGDQARVLRIVNGQQTSAFESVGIVNGQCTGTLIAPNAVLTAAHCVEGLNVSNMDFEVGGQKYDVSESYIHPKYSSNDVDLAVMVLKQDVQGVTPSDINRTAPAVGDVLTLVGFGGTGTSSGGHNGDFGVKHVGETPIDVLQTETILWNFDNASEANTAPGDSGGPAFVNVNGELVVAGVTSGGTQEDAGLGDQSFDSRVDTFATWIDNIVAGNPDTAGQSGGGSGDDSGGGSGDDASDEFDDELGDDFEDDFGGADGLTAEELASDELWDYDFDGDGALDKSELAFEFEMSGYDEREAMAEARQLIADFDTNGDRALDLGELIVSWGGDASGINEDDGFGDEVDGELGEGEGDEVVDDVDDSSDEFDDFDDFEDDDFDDSGFEGGEGDSPAELAAAELAAYDANGNGALSRSEIVVGLETELDSESANDEADYLIESFDTNGDNQLDLAELTASWGGEEGDLQDDVIDDGFDDNFDDGFDDFGGYEDDVWGDYGSDGVQGSHGSCDVNDDGAESPIDALMVVNFLNNRSASIPAGLDVNGDGEVTPIDALQVINRINATMATPVNRAFQVQQDEASDDQSDRTDLVFATSVNDVI